ncbi:MAG: hypothetical protein L3J08_09320 [Flavobacteriaceae bacterium]|nr:hypothetical protein [Flavobacteriaceae bacterium]
MKKIVILTCILFTFSCNDGNFEIASFEFETKVSYCGEYILYRLSTDGQKEALIVTLTDKEIKQSEEVIPLVNISKTGSYTVTYRIFDEAVTGSEYFCRTIPPTEPKTIKNWIGAGGTIFIVNTAIKDKDEKIIAYKHTITLNDLALTNNDESLLFDPSYFYGEFETTVE